LVAVQELFLEDLDGGVLVTATDEAAEVHLACVALSEGLQNLKLSIEDGVSLRGATTEGCLGCVHLEIVDCLLVLKL
jgi:hypothetical protein